jgi:hypothetical protein
MGATIISDHAYQKGDTLILRVRLPYPDKTLNPNRYRGMSWKWTAKSKEMARQIGYFEVVHTADYPNFDPKKPLRLRVAIFPPDNRVRDMDNVMGALKSYQDGVFDAYAGLDDSMIKRKTITWHDKCRNGKIYYILYQ